MKENGFTMEKKRSKRYPTQTITDTDYADDIKLLANSPAQTESMLYSLEKAVGSIDLHVPAYKIEYMWFYQNQTRDISILKDDSLTWVNKSIYLWSSLCSTEYDINTLLAKAESVIDWLSVICKSNLPDKINHSFLSSGHVLTTIWMHHMDAD